MALTPEKTSGAGKAITVCTLVQLGGGVQSLQKSKHIEMKKGSVESGLTGCAFLPGQVWWVVRPQAPAFFSKRLIFALSKPCPIVLCI